jgi:hypothetical protein
MQTASHFPIFSAHFAGPAKIIASIPQLPPSSLRSSTCLVQPHRNPSVSALVPRAPIRPLLCSPFSRRNLLQHAGGGFGLLPLAHLFAAGDESGSADASAGLHHPARVKRVIQLFMNGGASPMDTFDYKPELERQHGKSLGPKEKPEGFTAPAAR